MDLDSPEANAYLFELYTLTKGDPKAQVSMYDVGTGLGLEKTDAGAMAETLFIQGYAELKTLSGGIGITRQGLDLLQVKPVPESNPESLHLGTGPVLEGQGKETVEIQMLSPSPKKKIIREVLRSLHNNFVAFGPKDLSNALNSLIIS
ncbi:hypothetical protein [Desulfobacula sp.]|uniref:hypothetical protein n=1 Tax=Desulfobacula sp. TaxID=2593537 RepID=UPI00260F6E7F|nr:hypothetical protein [Desulfobacula sp.]